MSKTLTKKLPNYDILYDIIKKRKETIDLPKEDDLIIHLRIGDVIDWRWKGNIDELLEGKVEGQCFFGNRYNYKFFENELKKINSKIKRIILVGGYHTKGDHTRSMYYIKKIEKLFLNKGYEVEKRINKHTADEDFIYMCNSKNFIGSGGGYSKIISEMIKKNKY